MKTTVGVVSMIIKPDGVMSAKKYLTTRVKCQALPSPPLTSLILSLASDKMKNESRSAVNNSMQTSHSLSR